MSVQPLVSVIIPYYNHKNFIVELLDSIKYQTYKKIQTILIDDGSSDGSQQFLKSLQKKYHFKLIIKDNEGISKTINDALKLISGDYIVIIASDDVMPPNRVMEQVKTLMNSDYDVIGGGMTLISKHSMKLNYTKPRIIGMVTFDQALFYNPCFAPTLMFKAEVFKKYGLYNPKWIIEDYSMLLRLLYNRLKIGNFDKNWSYYRIQNENFIDRAQWYYKGVLQALSEYSDNQLALKAINHHDFIFRLKQSIFYGFKEINNFQSVFNYKEPIFFRFFRYITLLSLAVQPKFLRKFLIKLTLNKSLLLLQATKLFSNN